MSNPEGNTAESERCGQQALSGWAGPLGPLYVRQDGVCGERQVGVLQRKEAHQCTGCAAPAPLECPKTPTSTPTSKPSCSSGPHPGSEHFWCQCSEQHPTGLCVPVPSRSSFCSRVTLSGASQPPGCLSPSRLHSFPRNSYRHLMDYTLALGCQLWEEKPQNRSLVSSKHAC